MIYKMFKHFILVEGKLSRSYGIAAVSGRKVHKSYRDVSLNKVKVKELVRLLNKCGVSLVHLREVIEDFHCDNC